MSIQKQLKMAMVHKGIKYAKEVSKVSGVSYKRTLAVLNGSSEAYLSDAEIIGLKLGVKLSYISVEED
tara:strand:- start:3047 stop:3250 length:204 start_codon:yes stop_codon:yes gene_type:complete